MDQKTSILKSLLKGPKTREELRQDLNTEKVANFSKKLKELIDDKIVEEFPGVKEIPKKKVGRPKKGTRKGKKTGPAPKILRIREDIETFRKIYKDHTGVIHDLQKSPLVIDLLQKEYNSWIQEDLVILSLELNTLDIFNGLSDKKRTQLNKKLNHFHKEFLKKCLGISPTFFIHFLLKNTKSIQNQQKRNPFEIGSFFRHCVNGFDCFNECDTEEGRKFSTDIEEIENNIRNYANRRIFYERIFEVVDGILKTLKKVDGEKRKKKIKKIEERYEDINEYIKNNFIPTRQHLITEIVLGGVDNISNFHDVFYVNLSKIDDLTRLLRDFEFVHEDILMSLLPPPFFNNGRHTSVSSSHSTTLQDTLPEFAKFLKEENKS